MSTIQAVDRPWPSAGVVRCRGVADGSSEPADLLMVTDQVLDEMSERRKLTEPLLKQMQRIPDLEEMFG